MQHFRSLDGVRLTKPSVVTIGVFDGVHRGHQTLIRQLVDRAHATGRLAVVITFFPHPDIVLRRLQGRYYLTTPDEKAALLGELGVDIVVTQKFDEPLRHIRAASYVDMLTNHLRMAELWVGSDFAMGYQREGSVDFLQGQGLLKGFEVRVIDLLMNGHDAISSTAIRQALEQGEVDQARDWLGRSYTVEGEVVHGEKRGRELGFPTANLDVWAEKVVPANGIYAGWVYLGTERLMQLTNVGIRPMFESAKVMVETYILDFDRQLYGLNLIISFEKYLRPEMKFLSIQALIDQMRDDERQGRAFLESLS